LPWHFAAENGEQDKSCPPLSSATLYGKTGFTGAAVVVSFAGQRAPRLQGNDEKCGEIHQNGGDSSF